MTAPRIEPELLHAIRDAWRSYEQTVNATALMENAKKTYLLHSENFVRWLEGDFEPGAKLEERRG